MNSKFLAIIIFLLSFTTFSYEFSIGLSKDQQVNGASVLCYNVSGKTKVLNDNLTIDLEKVTESSFYLPVDAINFDHCDEHSLVIHAQTGITHRSYTAQLDKEKITRFSKSEKLYLRNSNSMIDNRSDNFSDVILNIANETIDLGAFIVTCVYSGLTKGHQCTIP
jgi:hypothetical protein